MVHELQYKGQLVPVKTDFSVISKVCTKYNLKFQEFAVAMDNPEQLLFLFKESVLRGYKLEGKVCPYKDEDFEEILSDDNFGDFVAAFNEDCVLVFKKKIK